MLFGYAGLPSYRHAWRTRHSTSTHDNRIDFLLWTPAQSASAIGSMEALSLVTYGSTNTSVHVRPASGTPTVELEVSDGSTIGGGTVHRAVEATHSSLSLKTDVRYLGAPEELRAYEEIASLRPVRFRYKGSGRKKRFWGYEKGPLYRGLLYEEVPAHLRGPGKSISVDGRVANAELAAKELIRRLEAFSREVADFGAGGPR